jgi:hypothetical protein
MAVGAARATGGGSSFWPALVGALVGGAVSLATTLLVEHQRAKNIDTERKRQLGTDARIAGRIIGLELSDIQSVLRISIQQTPFRWPPAFSYELPDRAWSEYSASLGAALSDIMWDEVALAYSSFKYANLLGSLNLATAKTMLAETEAAVRGLESWAEATSLAELP